MKVVEVGTRRKREIVDITDLCQNEISNSPQADGVCHLLVRHTTAALTIADLDPGTV